MWREIRRSGGSEHVANVREVDPFVLGVPQCIEEASS
jgi:hypothetical protein